MITLNAEKSKRVKELLKGETEVKPGYPNLTEDEATELLMLLYDISEYEARRQVWFSRGQMIDENLTSEPSTIAA